jgi:hypothetical protein
VRDALRIPGYIHVNDRGDVVQITLNERHPLAAVFHQAFASDDLSLILGQI